MLFATQSTIDQLLLKAALLEHLPAALFVFVLGACVGSFLNVVNYRMPRRMRLLVPPSNCPSCEHRLRFFRENLPIIGWLAIRGKCRYCKAPVSIEYPIVELATAVLFLSCYVLCYWVPTSTPFLGEIFGQWWHVNGIMHTLPMFIALLTLIAGLLSITIIDARTFTIPIQIPVFITVVAFLAAIVQPWLVVRHTPEQLFPYPLIDWTWAGGAFGGMIGVIFSCLLLKMGVFKYSFLDYEEYLDEDQIGDVDQNSLFPLKEAVWLVPILNIVIAFAFFMISKFVKKKPINTNAQSKTPIAENYPHARREMGKEILFIIPIGVCFFIGWMTGYEKGIPSMFVQGIAGSMLGYLIGGGLVWGMRIVGTLGFGKEAMGAGDVHLLAAVGAVVGWWDPILIFFIAPFCGLLWAGSSALLEKMGKQYKEIPYGPHLAVATLIVIFARPGVDGAWSVAMPGVEMPTSQKLQILMPEVDLTNESKQVSIRRTPLPVGYGKVKQDVSFVLLRCKSSEMEKGHA